LLVRHNFERGKASIKIFPDAIMKNLIPGMTLVFVLIASVLSASIPFWSKMLAVDVAMLVIAVAVWAAPVSNKEQGVYM